MGTVHMRAAPAPRGVRSARLGGGAGAARDFIPGGGTHGNEGNICI